MARLKRLLSSILLSSILLINSYALTSNPEELSERGQNHLIPLSVEAEVPRFSVTVPTDLPTYIYADGTIEVATDACIINNSNKPIQVTNIEIIPADGWTMVSYDSNVTEGEFAIRINDVQSGDGTFEWPDFKMVKESSLALDYNVLLPGFEQGLAHTSVANISIIVDWYEAKFNIESTGDVRYDGKTIVSLDEPLQLEAVQTFALRQPKWESSDESIATVDDTGLVTAYKPGAVTISYGDADFELMAYGTPVAASKSLISISDSNLVIPAHYRGADGKWYTVTSIASNGFKDCTSLTSISIPDTVTTIGEYGFKNCSVVTSFNVPESVVSLGGGSFSSCVSLESFVIPESVTFIGGSAFQGDIMLSSIVIPRAVTSMDGYVFDGCTRLENVKIYGEIPILYSRTFQNCTSLRNLYLPNSIKSIEHDVFSRVPSGLCVYFGGTDSEWSLIQSATGNDVFLTCTKYYNYKY